MVIQIPDYEEVATTSRPSKGALNLKSEDDPVKVLRIKIALSDLEYALLLNPKNEQTIRDARTTIIGLDGILGKYRSDVYVNAPKELQTEMHVFKYIIEHMPDDPDRWIAYFNDYIFPRLYSNYGFGFKHVSTAPWRNQK